MTAATQREHARVAEVLPSFTKAMAQVREGEAEIIVMTIGAFGAPEDAELLHTALRVAYDEGVSILFAPSSSADREGGVRDD